MGSPSFFMALRYLWGGTRPAREGGRYLRGAAAGIALSLVPIVVTLIVADGMIRGITDRYLELGTGHLEIYDYAGSGEFLPSVRDDVLALPGVRGAWRERQGLGIILGAGGRTGAAVRAVEKGFLDDPGSAAFLTVTAGSAGLEKGEALLGQGLAETLGAGPGSPVRLMTVRTAPDGRTIPRLTVFTVKGVVSSGYRELDALWCLVDYDAALDLLSPELYRTFLVVKVDDPYGGAERAAEAAAALAGPDYAVYTWKELQQSLFRSFESTRQMLLFIMALLVLVAAVNVSSATSMLVIDRRRDIAVLKTGGAGPRFIRGIFLRGAFLTGLAGSAAGIGAGLAIGGAINPIIRGLEKALSFAGSPWGAEVTILDPGYYLETIPVVIDGGMIALIGLFTLLCSCLASYIPARRAGKLRPLEILRRV